MSKKRISIGVTIALMALTATLTLTLTYQYAMNRFNQQVKNVTERQKMYAKLYQIDTKTRDQYLFPIDENTLNDAIASGYVNGLSDAHSQYLTQAECTALQQQLAGSEEGIGMEFSVQSSGSAVVSRIIEGAPAAVAGLLKNDRLTQVDGQDITGWSQTQIAEAITGDAGTEVVLTVLRADDTGEDSELSFTITRKQYHVVSVESGIVGENLGYIRIYTFNENTDNEFADALTQLTRSDVNGLIIDVRSNGGGTLESAAHILDSLLPAGSIVSSAGSDGKKTVLYTSDSVQTELPIAVLINEKSASAAELIAAAIQDYDKGTIIGTQSFGKGTLQELYTFTDGSGLSLTTSYFYPPLSANFEGTGVLPDIKVALDYTGSLDLLSADTDAQLSAAISKLEQSGEPSDTPTESGTESETQSDGESGAASGSTSGAETASQAAASVAYQAGCADCTRV